MPEFSMFEGDDCAICFKEFADDDDVVVCPECGSPHHRPCYALTNKCGNLALHNEGFEWKSDCEVERESLSRLMEAFEYLRQNKTPLTDRELEEQNIYGVSKAELSAFMRVEPDSPDFQARVKRIKVVNINVFAGLLLPFYQFCKGMRLIGLLVLVSLFFWPVAPVMTLLLLLFNDYIYLRHSAYKIKRCRSLYSSLPDEIRDALDYYSFLRINGLPSVARGIAETCIAILLLVMLVQTLS